MNIVKYPVVITQNHRAYEFFSDGPAGIIKKVVQYQEIADNFFNIAFGDWDEDLKGLNEYARSNNNDRDKILATVASTAVDFVKNHRRAIVFAKGNTPAKTRLYQMGISKHLSTFNYLFEIEGFLGYKWESFVGGRNYQAFTIRIRQTL